MSFIKRMLILIKLTFQTSRGGNMAPQWWKREGNGQNVKIFPVVQKLPQLYLEVNWANANSLRGFSELAMFNYKIKDYAPDIFFTYFLKARKLPLPKIFFPTSTIFMWFYSFCFWYEGMSIHLGIVFWNLVYKACFSHEAAEICYAWDGFYFGRVDKLNCSIILTGRICVIGT